MIQSTRSYTGYRSSNKKGGQNAASVDRDLRYKARREQQAKYWHDLKEAQKNGNTDKPQG